MEHPKWCCRKACTVGAKDGRGGHVSDILFVDDERLAVALLQIPGAAPAVMITDDEESVVVPVEFAGGVAEAVRGMLDLAALAA